MAREVGTVVETERLGRWPSLRRGESVGQDIPTRSVDRTGPPTFGVILFRHVLSAPVHPTP